MADKPAITNLLTVHSLLSGVGIPELEAHFAGKGYGALKTELAAVVVDALRPIQERFAELERNPDHALTILAEGAERARERAEVKMALVRERMGLELTPVRV
jgi:tryptophanyl-tRNA synthetase